MVVNENSGKLACTLFGIVFIVIGNVMPVSADVRDQEKLLYDATNGYILYFSDGNSNGFHDPGEAYYDYVNGPLYNGDMSCWMAAASNVITHAGIENGYIDWLGQGLVPSPIDNPWGDEFYAGGGGSHYTFDDGGYSNWVFEELEIPVYGPIITTTEFSTSGWTIDPIGWCQAELQAGHPVAIDIWWGDAKRGWLPGGFFNAPGGYYHAITLWEIDETAQTMIITDSDDRIIGSREVSYTFTGNDWVITELYPGWPGRINYAAGADLPVVSVPGVSGWGIPALIILLLSAGLIFGWRLFSVKHA
jgi:hypothetical protein